MILFVGGIRSGKSLLAEKWAEAMASRRLYIATGRPLDEEMAARITAHRERRKQGWLLLEEPFEPANALENFLASTSFKGSILLDSLDMLLANMLEKNPGQASGNVREMLGILQNIAMPCAIVSSECGLGLVGNSAIGRSFQDLLGQLNQYAASICDDVIFSFCGLPVAMKGKLPQIESWG